LTGQRRVALSVKLGLAASVLDRVGELVSEETPARVGSRTVSTAGEDNVIADRVGQSLDSPCRFGGDCIRVDSDAAEVVHERSRRLGPHDRVGGRLGLSFERIVAGRQGELC
jgi:hypothetical protein